MKHWVFDLDGTLVDSFGHYFVLLEEIFSRSGARFAHELRVPALTEKLPEFFEKHLGARAVEPAMSELQSRSNEDAKSIRPFDGVMATLESLRAQGARIAVWTNRDLVSSELILKHSGLSPLVDLCVSGSCVEQRKPHPEGLLRIIDHFKCLPDSVTMVGDHEYDVLGGKTAGARAVRASWHSYWLMANCTHADFQFHHFSEFAAWAEGARS